MSEQFLPTKCERCPEPGIACNDDGHWLCEDCLFEEQCQRDFPHDSFGEDLEEGFDAAGEWNN